MKLAFQPSFLGLLAALPLLAQVVTCLQVSVSATHKGQAIDASDIVLREVESTSNLFKKLHDDPAPPTRNPRGQRRSERREEAGPLGKRNEILYTGDWCGATSSTPSTNKITNVQGYYQVPAPTVRASQGTPQYAGAWVGIDGVTWSTSLVQAGTASAIAGPGETAFWAWFEWVPAASYIIDSFPVDPGDWIWVSITPSSSTAAVIIIENYTQSYTYTVNLSGGTALGQLDADWIVEDPYGSSGQEPFPDFGDIWFEDVYATTSNGTYLDVATSSIIYLDSPTLCKAAEYDANDFYAWST
jgi:hypothetical protein